MKLFISYSHKDERYLKKLKSHLAPLKREGLVSEWHDRKISVGDLWEDSILKNLDESKIILLLVSPDFIASEYCYGKELKRAMELHEAGASFVIPIIVRPVDWKKSFFAKIQAAPTDAKPISTWKNQDEAWVNTVSSIREVLHKGEVNEKAKSINFQSIENNLLQEYARLGERYSKSISLSGLPTGFSTLDAAIDGIPLSEVTLVASRPGAGSNDFIRNIVESTVLENKRCVYFNSIENTLISTRRMISSVAQIEFSHITNANIASEDWRKISSTAGALSECDLMIEDTPDLPISSLLDGVRSLHEEKRLDLVVIDDLQHIQHRSKDELVLGLKKIKSVARSLKVPFLINFTLPVDCEKRADKRPILHDIEGFQGYADVILFLYRLSMYRCDVSQKVELIVEKNTNGSVGTIPLRYDTKFCKLEEDSSLETEDIPF